MINNYKKQVENYLKVYWNSNKNNIIERLNFLLKEFENMPDYVGPTDIWYYFEEARHTFMMGDFIASIIVSASTIELWMSWLLKIPFYTPRGKSIEFDEFTFGRLLKTCISKKIINKQEESNLKKLNNLRTFYVHGKDVLEKPGYKRESKSKSKFWGSEILQNYYNVDSIEKDAKDAIKILFEFYRNHHYINELKYLK